jgi:hypothetical protein
MVGPRPHIDRTQLRDHLRHMEQPGGSRVLVVSGSNGCGKTHTWFAISDLAERLGTFEARYVDVSQHAGQPAALADVMDLVAYSLLGKPAPTFDPEAQPDTVINRFVAWLTFEAATRPKPAWLVFDGFTADCASRAAQDLVTAVAMAADRRALPAVLVTVLGFAGKAGPDVLSYAFRDQPGRPQRADLARFFTGFAQLHGVQTDDAGVEVLVEELLGLGPLEELPLGELSRHAHELALTAFGVSDG